MKNQLITDTVRCQINYDMDGNNASNVFHVQYSGTVGFTELDTLETEIADWLTTGWKPIASEDWSAISIELTDMNSLAGVRKAYAVAPPIVGGLAEEALPANATVAVKASVGHRGKGINGRVFWVGLAKTQTNADQITTVTGTALTTALEGLNSGIALVTPFVGMAVPHLVVNKVPVNPAESELVETFLVSDYTVDTQKDRLPNHKRKRKARTTP